MTHVERIAASGVVHIVAAVVRYEPVVRGVVDATEAQCRSEVAAFGRVVVDDVEDDLDAGRVQRLDHGLEIAVGLAGGGIELLRGEVADRVVAPVVPQALRDEVPVVHERVDRHQLDGRDAEPPQVLDDGCGREGRVRTVVPRRNFRMTHRETAHVHLVDHGVVPRRGRRPVVAPAECGIDDLTLRHTRCVVASVERQVATRVADPVAEVRIAPGERPDDRFRVRIDQQLVGIESVAVLGLVGSVDAVAVQLTRPDLGQVAVPDLVGPLPEPHALELAAAARIEQGQIDGLRALREEREVDALAVPGRALRIGLSRPDLVNQLRHRRRSAHDRKQPVERYVDPSSGEDRNPSRSTRHTAADCSNSLGSFLACRTLLAGSAARRRGARRPRCHDRGRSAGVDLTRLVDHSWSNQKESGMGKSQKRYTPEFRRQMVELYPSGRSFNDLAERRFSYDSVCPCEGIRYACGPDGFSRAGQCTGLSAAAPQRVLQSGTCGALGRMTRLRR